MWQANGQIDEQTDGRTEPFLELLGRDQKDIMDESNQIIIVETYSTCVWQVTVKKTSSPLTTFCFRYNLLYNIKNIKSFIV